MEVTFTDASYAIYSDIQPQLKSFDPVKQNGLHIQFSRPKSEFIQKKMVLW